MEPIDNEEERKRLAEAYSTVTNEQLEELAEKPDALTDLALGVLNDELKRRGLNLHLQDYSPPMPDDELVTIRFFRDLPEALLAKGLLESAGIECSLADDNFVRLDWFISNAIGNIKLQVKKADAEVAVEILDQPVADDQEDADP